jgi:uncharacterized membrane protein YfcA
MLFMILTGSLVGLISSYFGVGACFIMVPAIIYFLESTYGVSPSLAPLIAFGTSMAVVVPVALSGVLRHRKELGKKGLSFPMKHYLSFGLPVGLGSFVGAIFAFILFTSFRTFAGILLKTAYGILCLLITYRFIVAKPIQIKYLKAPRVSKYACGGLFSGMLAHFIGIGGGSIYVPVLNRILNIPIHLAIPLSLATMVIGSSIGSASFTWLGHIDQIHHTAAYPIYTFGWFSLIAFLIIGIPSIIMAQVGPYLSQRTSPQKFKVLLAILYVYIGVRLTVNGIFQLQSLPPPLP